MHLIYLPQPVEHSFFVNALSWNFIRVNNRNNLEATALCLDVVTDVGCHGAWFLSPPRWQKFTGAMAEY